MQSKICLTCKITFFNKSKTTSFIEFNKRKYCSLKCFTDTLKVIRKIVCPVCKKERIVNGEQYHLRKIYCSLQCSRIDIIRKRQNGKIIKCLECKKQFYVPLSLIKQMFCSKQCSFKSNEIGKRISLAKLGKPSKLKGKTIFKNEEEKRQASLASGRKSYRKHLKERLFYYRQLSHKRRGTKGTHTLKEWDELKKKHNYCCVTCGLKEPFNQYHKKLTQDHIIPISKGGSNNIENIQPLCGSCNCKKHNKI